jgi:uroporphyrinogen decarboxylase
MALTQPDAARRLLEVLTETVTRALRAQIEAGAQAVQLFDTWAGLLAPRDFRELAAPWARRVLDGVRDLGVPTIYFARGTAGLLGVLRETGADMIGLDWRVELDAAREALGGDVAVQGNLDPVALLGPPEHVEQRARDVLRRAAGTPGHVFNLGHGILPPTPEANVDRLVEVVRTESAR